MKKQGFTLAEVLITLVIIGVVAALTVPTLIKANKRIETEAQLKKSFSVFANALKLSIIDNGDFNTWDLADTNLYENNIAPYLKFAKKCSTAAPCTHYNWYFPGGGPYGLSGSSIEEGGYLADGTFFDFYQEGPIGAGNCQNSGLGCLVISIDLNGEKKPNILGKDIFWFSMFPGGKFATYRSPAVGQDLNTAITDCKTQTTTGRSALNCTAWIMSNGWKIPDDYPWL